MKEEEGDGKKIGNLKIKTSYMPRTCRYSTDMVETHKNSQKVNRPFDTQEFSEKAKTNSSIGQERF